jgi:hypothetical protein
MHLLLSDNKDNVEKEGEIFSEYINVYKPAIRNICAIILK